MRVAVLGPTQAFEADGSLATLAPKQRVVLARLAMERGRSVADDHLIEALWPRNPPVSARKTLQGHIHWLRRVLGQDALVRLVDGYSLVTAELDVDRAARLTEQARADIAESRHDAALDKLRRARSLFRGRPAPELDDIPEVDAWRRHLAELEWQATELWLEATIADGAAASAVAELELLIDRDPTRERAWCILTKAFASLGRQADALDAVARARQILARELGISPGAELAALEQQVLEQRFGRAPPVTTRPADRDGRFPVGLSPGDDDLPLLGRQSELELLNADFQRVLSDARLRVTIVIGGAGVGKTRLASEFARGSHLAGALVTFGRCTESTPVAYEPIVQALQGVIDGGKLDHDVRRQIAELLKQMSAGSPSRSASGSIEADRYELFERIALACRNISFAQPMVLVLDDLHWAAPPTVAALEHLVRRSGRAAIMVVATVRSPEFGATDIVGPLGTESNVRLVTLDGLDLSSVKELVAQTDRQPEGTDDRARELFHRTGGNPFFVTELVRNQTHRDRHDSRSVPELVRDVIRRRARRLPYPAADILDVAAVIGLHFDLDLLAEATQRPHLEVIDALDACVRSQLVSETDEGRLAYRFRHALIRDALMAGSSAARQALIHERVAAALERSPPPRTLTLLSRLAYHYLASATPPAVASGAAYAEQAGIAATEAFAHEDACAWFQRAIEAADPSDRETACRLRLALARAATATGQQSRARAVAVEAWRLARELDDGTSEIAAVLLHAGEPELNVVGNEPGVIMLAATLDLGLGTPGERSRIMSRLGSGLSYQEHSRATQLALDGLELARSGGDDRDVAYSIRCRLRGWFDPEDAAARLELAAELTSIGRSTGDGITESWGVRWENALHIEMASIDEIEVGCARLEEYGTRLHIGNHRFAAAARLAALRTAQGRFDEARELVEIADERRRQLDNVLLAQIFLAVVATLEWLRGELPASRLIELERQLDENPATIAPAYMLPSPGKYTRRACDDPQRTFGDDVSRLWEVVSAALAVRLEPDDELRRAAYPWALRHVDRYGTAQPARGMFGSMHLYAGLLASDRGAAIHHLRAAVDRNRALGLLPYEALALHELAERTSDRRERRAAATAAHEIATAVKIPWLT